MTANKAPGRALVVIDVQNDYDGGKLGIAHPPIAESLANIGRAMDAARHAGVKIVVARHISPATSPVFAAGSHGAALHPAVADRPRDHYVEKTLPSAFTGTDLEPWLRREGIDTITVAGYMTQNCVFSTVVHAVHIGLDVEILADATGAVAYENAAGSASAEEIHRVMLVVMQARFAAVCTTGTWIDALGTGILPERDNIYMSNQRALAKMAAT